MGQSIWDLFVALGYKDAGFDQGLESAVTNSKKASSSIGSNLADIGKTIATGLAVVATSAATATAAFAVSAVGSASDLNETLSKNSVVFGKYSFIVQEWGKSAAQSLGMSTNEAVGAAATYGNLFVSMGMTEQASSGMSTGLVQLAGDLASFNNMPTAEVLEKLRAGLTGETEPLKTLGVNINAAMLEAKALDMGLIKNGQTMTAAQKATASYALIMEQTKTAQGDFARTSGGLANQQRILGATFENVKATVGTALLPVVTQIANQMNAWLSDPAISTGLTNIAAGVADFAQKAIAYIPKVVAWFQQVGAWFRNNQGVIVAILGTITLAVIAFGVSSLIAMAPIILTLGLVGLAIYLLYQAWTTNFGGMRDTLMAIWDGILKPIFTDMGNWLQVNIPVALAWLSNAWTTVLLPAIQAVFNWISTVLVPLWQSEIAWLQDTIPAALAFLGNAWTTVLLPAITSVWSWMNTVLFPLFKEIGLFFEAAFSLAIRTMANVWTEELLPKLKEVWDYISPVLLPLFEEVAKFLGGGGPFQSAIGSAASWISDRLTDAIHWLNKEIGNAVAMLAALRDAMNGTVGLGSNVAGGNAVLPGRANGGPVSAGTAYTVGERGPETFVPNTSGTIIPHGAGNTTNMGSITIIVNGVGDPKKTADAIALRLASYGSQYQGM
jgi:hypothetical protein